MSLGNQIHELRKKNSLSQEQLAEKVGVARQTISKWELGETSPDIRQAQMLSQIFRVSLEELLGEDTKESVDATQVSKTNNAAWARIIAVIAAVISLCLVIVGVLAIVGRAQILYPEGAGETVAICVKDPILITNCTANTIVFNESGKPAIACRLPEGFASDPDATGLYTDESGNSIMFNSDYEGNVANPILGTEYYLYYEDRGYDSYMDIARMAMYYDRPRLGIFSTKEELYLAGGSHLIRGQFCAGQNADYYEIGGELTASGDEMRIYGFALHLENGIWLITLKDYEDNYYFITIKDPDGLGNSPDVIGEFLSSVFAGNALRYSSAKDSAAIQNARNAYVEYIAVHGNAEGYYVFQADNSRFAAFHNGTMVGLYSTVADALNAMLSDPDLSKLSATGVEDLWIYGENGQ